MTSTFDPTRHPDGRDGLDPQRANVVEGPNAPDNVLTPYSIGAGDSFSGTLESIGDRDWVAISVTEGETYQVDLLGAGSGEGTLPDSYLRLFDGEGRLVEWDDDGGAGFDSALYFTAETTGTYFVSAGAFSDRFTGTYRIEVDTVRPPDSAELATLDELADYLTGGYWQDQGLRERSFDLSTDNRITVNIDALTADGQQLARWAFEAWEMVADIDFVQTSGFADISFDDAQSGAFAMTTTSGSRILSAEVNVDTQWINQYGATIDSYSFATYIHEIGHALGLGHQGDYNSFATYGRDATFTNDSWQVSVMSYFDQSVNTTVDASYGSLISTMMSDILAVQNLYGTPGGSSATAGDTVWGANTTLPGYFGEFFGELSGERNSPVYDGGAVAFTIYDQGGIDTIDLSPSITDDRIDLRAERFSDVGGQTGSVGIARGTVLENLIAGSGNDAVTGNNAGNRIEGRGGNDTVEGGIGRDRLFGGDGNDELSGNNAFDRLFGEDGDDILSGGNGRDTVNGGDGNDLLRDNGQRGDLGRDVFIGANGNDTVQGGGSADTIFGGKGTDTLFGRHGNDEVYGGNGADRMFGNLGADTLFGGNGQDTVNGGNGHDLLRDNGQRSDRGRDTFFGQNGNDTVQGGGASDTIYGGKGQDVLFGRHGGDDMHGGGGFDEISGNLGADTLDGGNGRDTMRGGEGNDLLLDNGQTGTLGGDLMRGGTGDDTLQIGAATTPPSAAPVRIRSSSSAAIPDRT